MRQSTVELFLKEGVNQNQAKELMKLAKEERLTKAQCAALELAHKKKLIESGDVCGRCGRATMLSVDHIIPKSILEVMGVDVERAFMPENLMILCRPCNGIKSSRLDFSIPQTKAVLLSLLEKL